MRSQKISLAVRDLIQKSKLFTEGPPARYRLLTTRSNLNEDGTVRKWYMQCKILLMVGETGTGKITLIYALVNYILGVKFTDEVWFEITEERDDNHMSDQSKSQTNKITVYEVFAQDNPICLTIMDTPGYGDTSGTDTDKRIAENLYKLFQNETGVKEIDAVCLVVKATENRLSDRQQYIFDAVLSLFGKDIENNIVVLFTHSDGMPPTNALNAIKKAGIPCRKDEENEPEHFLFNNRQTEKRSPKYDRHLQTAWEQTEENFNIFVASLQEQNRKSLEQTKSVLMESQRLEACISNLKERIILVDGKDKELTQIQKCLEENQEKIKRSENFPLTVTKTVKKKVSTENEKEKSEINKKVTSCTVCKENCHVKCLLAWSPRWCKVMDKGHCLVCTHKCHHTEHVKERMKYVTDFQTTTLTYYDLEQQYESNYPSSDTKFDPKAFESLKNEIQSNKEQKKEKICLEERLKKDLIKTKEEKAKLVEEACKIIMKLSQIALNPDSAFIAQVIDFMIPQAEGTGKHNCALKLQELKKTHAESQGKVNAVMGYCCKIENVVTGKK